MQISNLLARIALITIIRKYGVHNTIKLLRDINSSPFFGGRTKLKVLSLNIEMKTLDIAERWAQFSGECSELHWELFAEHSFHRVTQTGGRD